MASGEIRPRSILRPGSNYEQPPVFGRARTAGSTKSASSSTNSTSTELGSRIKRTFGLNKSTNSPSKISTPRSSTSERAKPKADAESKNTDRASTTSTRPAIEPLDTNKLQALSSQVSRFGRPPPVGQKSGLRVTENAGLSSHRRTQSVADSGPASAPLPQNKEVRSRFGFGSGSSSNSKQSSPPISTNSKKPTTLSKNAIDTIDTDDDFDVDRLVDGLRQEVRNESANNSVKEMARHRRHHSLMGSASIAGDVRAGWSAAASAALERARLRAASTNDPNATAITTAKPSTFERNGTRSASGSFEEHRASRSGTPVSITSRQNNAPSKQQRQQQQQQQQQQQSLTAMSLDSQRIPRGHQRRGNSDESVPTLSPSSSNEPSPPTTTKHINSNRRPSLISNHASFTQPPIRSPRIVDGHSITGNNPDRLLGLDQQNTYQSLLGVIKDLKTPPLEPVNLMDEDADISMMAIATADVEEEEEAIATEQTQSPDPNTRIIRADWLARARARGGSTVDAAETTLAVQQHHRRHSSLLDEKYFSADDTRTASVTEDEEIEEEVMEQTLKSNLKNVVTATPSSTSISSVSASSIGNTNVIMNHGIPSVNMMRRTSSSSIASSTLANATIMEEESANMRVNSAMSQRYSTSIDRSTSLRREQSSRTNSIHINSSARSSLDQQRSHPFDDSIDDTVDTILNENEDTAAQYTTTGPTPSVSSLLDSQRRIRRLSLHQASSSASSLSRFRKSDMDPMSLSLPSLSRPSTTNSISPSTTQRANLPSQWTRSNQLNASPVSNLSKLASSHTADTNDAVDDILRSIDAEDNDNHAIVCNSNSGDQDQRKRAVRGTLRTLNGKVADDSSTDADSPRLSIRTSIEGLRAPRGIVSRPILASTNDRNAHARSMSDFPDSVLAGDYAAVQELMETRATASTTDGYGNITSTNNGYGNLSALARGRTSVSNTATPTTPHRFHRIERATSLTSSNFIERFNNMNLTTPDDVSIANTTRLQRSSSRRSRTGNDDASDHSSSGRTPSLVSSRLNGLNSGNTEVNAVDGICTRAQKLLVRAQQEFCTARRTSTTLSNNSGNNSAGLQTPTRSLLSVLDGQRQPLDTNLPAGVSLSPHLGPVTSSSLNDTNQYLNPGSNDAQFAGPSVESRLDEVVESSIRLDRILRQVSTDLRKGHTAEASQAAIDLWRDSEQIVRGLTDVLLGLSAGVPRARSPAILPLNDRAVTSQTNNGGSSTPVNESPRGTPTRLFRVTGGISGKLSANGRAIPTPLQLPTPVSDHEQVNDVPLSAVSQFVSDTASMEMNKLSNSNGIVSHGSIRRQRALSQLISPSTRTGSFFTLSSTTPTTATTLPASAVTTPTTPNGTRHTRARTITSSFANGAYSGLASSRTFPSASQQYSNVTTHGLSKTDTTATATSLRSNHHNMAKSTAPIDDIRSPSLSARRF